jgi:hypothetical protein
MWLPTSGNVECLGDGEDVPVVSRELVLLWIGYRCVRPEPALPSQHHRGLRLWVLPDSDSAYQQPPAACVLELRSARAARHVQSGLRPWHSVHLHDRRIHGCRRFLAAVEWRALRNPDMHCSTVPRPIDYFDTFITAPGDDWVDGSKTCAVQ